MIPYVLLFFFTRTGDQSKCVIMLGMKHTVLFGGNLFCMKYRLCKVATIERLLRTITEQMGNCVSFAVRSLGKTEKHLQLLTLTYT